MSVTVRDIGAENVPDSWIERVNKRINDLHHQDQCACAGWPADCVSGIPAGRWDEGVSVLVAAVELEPLIRDRILAQTQTPNHLDVVRQLEQAGHARWDIKERETSVGFHVESNDLLVTDGVAVLHFGQGESPEVRAALEAYAATLREIGYDAAIEPFASTPGAVMVRCGNRAADDTMREAGVPMSREEQAGAIVKIIDDSFREDVRARARARAKARAASAGRGTPAVRDQA